MIFKAIVASVIRSRALNSNDTVYVTIPVLDGSSSKNNFKGVNKRLATVCSLPGCKPKYAEGDVVYVDFEQDDMSKPVIIGSLLSSKSNSSVIDLYANSLTVDVNTQLPNETYVDDVQISEVENSSANTNASGMQTMIDVVGLLQGEGGGVIKAASTATVKDLNIDTIPIEDSTNLITSGGVYSIANVLNNRISYGTVDLTENVSPLPEGYVYLYYE